MKFVTIKTALFVVSSMYVLPIASGSTSKVTIPNGTYSSLDIEDSSYSKLDILCTAGLCDVILSDSSFSTCIRLTGNPYNGGVGVARNIPQDSLDDFKLSLFCLNPGQVKIDTDNDIPVTTLTGNMVVLEDGIIRRTGPGFNYFKTSISSIDRISNGFYSGTDTDDGTTQGVEILCIDRLCDVILKDSAFIACAEITGNPFYGGFGLARNIPEDSLDDFEFNLFCLQKGELELDIDNDTPTATIPGGFILEDGVIRRTGPGYHYFKASTHLTKSSSGKKASKKSDNTSEAKIVTGRYVATDTEDGSVQGLDILCTDGLCDITLSDSSFSTCIKITGNPYLSGVGIARDIPEDLLGSFDLDLFCLQPGQDGIDIDNDTPKTTLTGDMSVLEDGIIRRTGPGFTFYSVFTGHGSGDKSSSGRKSSHRSSKVSKKSGSSSKGPITNGKYDGTGLKRGSVQPFFLLCIDGLCDIELADVGFNDCTILTGKPIFNGVAIARDVPEDSLDNFDINLFCIPQGETEVDINNDTPTSILSGDLIFLKQDGILRRTTLGYTYFKTSRE